MREWKMSGFSSGKQNNLYNTDKSCGVRIAIATRYSRNHFSIIEWE